MLNPNFDLRHSRLAFSLNKSEVKCHKTDRTIERMYAKDHNVIFDELGYILNIWNFSIEYCDFSKTPVKVPDPGSELKFDGNDIIDLEEKILWFPWLMTMCSAKRFCIENSDYHILLQYKHPSMKSSSYSFDWVPLSKWDEVKFRSILTGKAYVIEKKYKTPYEYLPSTEIIVSQNYDFETI